MHRDWWGPSRDTRVSFLSLFLFLARSFSPIGPIVSSLSLSDRVPCTFFSLFSPVFNSSCLFFSFFFPSHFTFFVNRTVRVSSGEKVDALLPSKLSRFRLSSPFKLKKKDHLRSFNLQNPSISIQTRYWNPIQKDSLSLSLPVPSSSLHPVATLEVIFGSVHASTIPSDLRRRGRRRRRYLVGRPTGESARLNGAKDKE